MTRLEPPAPETARAEDGGDPEIGSLFAYLDTGKRSRVLDVSSPDGRAELGDALDHADVVIESSAPGPLQPVSDAVARARV